MGISNALRLAKVILNGFDAFFGDFQNVTLGAQARFEQADWLLVHASMSHRLEMYKKKVKDVLLSLMVLLMALQMTELCGERLKLSMLS